MRSIRNCDKLNVDVAMVGARLHYAVPCVLDRAGLLGTFYTDIYLGNKPWLRKVLNVFPDALVPVVLQRLRGRDAEVTPARVVSFDAFGLRIAWRSRRVHSQRALYQLHAKSGKEFCKNVAQKGLSGAFAIYAFNGAALEIFEEAKRRGILCILEQTIAPRQIEEQLIRREAQRWAGWEPGLIFDSETNPVAEREQAEWALADRIVCGSEFVAGSLRSLTADRARCCVVPYGIDRELFRTADLRWRADKLNVLFVGAVGLRKGVPYMLEALRRLNSRDVHCRLVGKVVLDRRRLADYAQWVEVMGPVPRSEIMGMYRWADVFVLPSICEGSATVTYEALACSLPVITTPNAGSVVRDGQEGFIVPVGDSDAIADRLNQLLRNEQLLRVMSSKARERSREFDLASYGERLVERIISLIDQPGCATQVFSGRSQSAQAL